MIDDTNVDCDHEWHDYVQAINRPDGGIYVPAGKTARDIAGFEYLGQMCARCGKVEPPESVVNPKLPATGPYVDRIIRIFRDRCYDDGSAIVLHDYAVEALRLNTAIAQQLTQRTEQAERALDIWRNSFRGRVAAEFISHGHSEFASRNYADLAVREVEARIRSERQQ